MRHRQPCGGNVSSPIKARAIRRSTFTSSTVVTCCAVCPIQARCRCHPGLPPGRARAMRVNDTHRRGGAVAYLAAYDIRHARVFGRTEERTGIPFMNLVIQVMDQEPYASAKRVYWIVDNDSSHRGQKAADRLTAAFPNAVMVHTPVHASWLNQVEIYFSVVRRKAVSPQRLHRPCPGQEPAPSLRRPPQHRGTAVPVEVHHRRPGRCAGPAGPARRRSPRRILRCPDDVINPRRIYGADHSARPAASPQLLRIVAVAGGHHHQGAAERL